MSYTTNTNWTEARSRREIVTQLTRWNHDNRYSAAIIGKYDFPVPEEVGSSTATVRFELRGQAITVACSSQSTYQQNLRCVVFAIESMRMNEKRGIADTLAKAYLQLAPPPQHRDPYEVMGLRPDADMEAVEVIYKTLAKTRHPDAGGSDAAMKELNEAIERIREERNGAA